MVGLLWFSLCLTRDGRHIMVQRLSDTKRSAHVDAVLMLCMWVSRNLTCTEQTVNTKREAEGLSEKIEDLEAIFLTILGMTFLKE